MAISASATRATGMLIQKMDRQVHSIRYPPAIGPIAGQRPGDAEEQRQGPAARAQVEGNDHDGDGGREHDRPAEALQRAERHQPCLGGAAARDRRDGGAMGDVGDAEPVEGDRAGTGPLGGPGRRAWPR